MSKSTPPKQWLNRLAKYLDEPSGKFTLYKMGGNIWRAEFRNSEKAKPVFSFGSSPARALNRLRITIENPLQPRKVTAYYRLDNRPAGL